MSASIEQIPFHPLANIFPLLEGVYFRDLVEDIRVNGLLEPILLFEGAILDGRNRARACHAAQVPARYRTYDGRDPVALVVSANLHRRHLDVSQRAMIAATISEKRSGGRRGTSQKVGTLVKRPRPERYKTPRSYEKVSMKQAASLLNVSNSSVTAASKVIKSGVPELVRSVEQGNISASAAAVVASFKHVQQRNILTSGSKAISVLAREDKAVRQKKPRVGRPEAYDYFTIGNGRSIGTVRFGELAHLEQLMNVTARILHTISKHVANGNHSSTIREMVTASWLEETIDRIWDEVKSESRTA